MFCLMKRAGGMESVRLEQVVQTVAALEAVVLRAFGPQGGQVLFTRDTGQAMLSRSGARILTVLRLDNPLARMIVDCASSHSASTGDGSKTFVLLLGSLVRMITAASCNHQMCSPGEDARFASARRLAAELLSFSLLQLDDLLAAGVLPHGQSLSWQDLNSTSSSIQKLLSSFFHTRLGYANCSFVSGLLGELLSNWTPKNDQPASSLQFLNVTWSTLYTPVTGFPLGYSRIIEGQVIHRDFATALSLTPQGPVKAVVFNGPLRSKVLDTGETLEICNSGDILQFTSRAESSAARVVAHLKSMDVSVLLSSVKQSAVVLALAAQAQIRVVECVEREELALFRRLSGATAVYDHRSVGSEHVVSLEFCKTILLGAHRYVHVGFPENQSIKPSSLVICGAGEGQTEQHVTAMQDAIRMLLTTWQPPTSAKSSHGSDTSSTSCPRGCVIPAGGTFEFLLSQRILCRDVNAVSQILAHSLLCVPRHIYSHHPSRHFAIIKSDVLKSIQSPVLCENAENNSHFASGFSSLDSGLESVSCKQRLLLAVLQCVSRLFRIDAVICTRSSVKTITDTSWEDSEDEHEN